MAAATLWSPTFHAVPLMVSGVEETGNATVTLQRTYAYLARVHEARCEPPVKLLFARMPTFGVSNDINSVVLAFAKAIRESRQLVILPPTAERRRYLLPLAGRFNADRPWHWLGTDVPLNTLLHYSACQRYLSRRMPEVLDMLGNSTNAETLAEQIPELAKLSPYDWDVRRGHVSGFHVTLTFIPPWLQIASDGHQRKRPLWKYGLLWWFEVLTNFLIRIRGELARRLRTHPALAALRGVERTSPLLPSATLRTAPSAFGSWRPSANFDIGLQIRMGDACGVKVVTRALRNCISTLAQALDILEAHGVTQGRMFLATDSQDIVDQAQGPGARRFQIIYLAIPREKYQPVTEHMGHGRWRTRNVEDVLTRNESSGTTSSMVAEEALLDALLLSRSSLIAGSMSGNMPRLALNLRVRQPNRTHYVTLDKYDWCAEPSCKPTVWARGMYARGSARNALWSTPAGSGGHKPSGGGRTGGQEI